MCSKCDEKKQKSNCKSPIVGAWACNFTAVEPVESVGEVYAANVAYSDGGTFTCDVDIANQRPFFGFPDGSHGTVISGTWKQVSKHHFKLLGTLVALSFDTNTNTWQPVARIKEVTKLKLHGDSYTGTRTLRFYDYYDISLTQELPVPPLVQTIKAKRVVE